MAAPILWTPGQNASVLQEKAMSIKFLVLGGGILGLGGGGSADFIFMGARIFLIFSRSVKILVRMVVALDCKKMGH